MILDTGINVYVWQGENVSPILLRFSSEAAKMYMEYMKRDKTAVVVHVKKGEEPFEFQKVFHGWGHWLDKFIP